MLKNAAIKTSNPDEFLSDFVILSKIGRTPSGGVDRQAASRHDGETRRWLFRWLESHDVTPRIDHIGNLFGLVEFRAGAPYVLAGSHLDSQPTAGAFDGAYGVLAAAHAVTAVRDAVNRGDIDQPRYNLAIVNWFNEEGSRFAPSIMGSGVYSGELDLQTCLSTTDEKGTSVRQALTEIGFLGDQTAPFASAYIELHIEQGRSLENHGVDIGLVFSNWAVSKLDVTLEGEQAHTGTAAIVDRRDALVGAAKMIVLAHDMSQAKPENLLVSVGRVSIYPNVPGVVPSRVTIAIDIRSPSESLLEEALRELTEKIFDIGESGDLAISLPDTPIRPCVIFPEAELILGEIAADVHGLSHQRMVTRAGHDAIRMNRMVPTLLAFVPSENGVSHSESERTSDADLVNGISFLTQALAMLASSEAVDLKDH